MGKGIGLPFLGGPRGIDHEKIRLDTPGIEVIHRV
jgi:hypothetical protein